MLRAIQEFFQARIEPDSAAGPDQHGLRLASAALLFEMLRADNNDHPQERRVIERTLSEQFGLSGEETRALAELADREAAEAVSLYQFTGLINAHFSPEQKVQVVEMLWQVALADDHVDPYEEALVRKIAELIYVPHRDFIRAKHRVQDNRA